MADGHQTAHAATTVMSSGFLSYPTAKAECVVKGHSRYDRYGASTNCLKQSIGESTNYVKINGYLSIHIHIYIFHHIPLQSLQFVSAAGRPVLAMTSTSAFFWALTLVQPTRLAGKD